MMRVGPELPYYTALGLSSPFACWMHSQRLCPTLYFLAPFHRLRASWWSSLLWLDMAWIGWGGICVWAEREIENGQRRPVWSKNKIWESLVLISHCIAQYSAWVTVAQFPCISFKLITPHTHIYIHHAWLSVGWVLIWRRQLGLFQKPREAGRNRWQRPWLACLVFLDTWKVMDIDRNSEQ